MMALIINTLTSINQYINSAILMEIRDYADLGGANKPPAPVRYDFDSFLVFSRHLIHL